MDSMNSKNNSMSTQDADSLWQIATERQNKTNRGLSATSVGTFKQTVLTTGGVMMRAATGRLGNKITAARVTSVIVALDASGSMYGSRAGVVQGINEMIRDLASDKNPQRDEIELTMWLFSHDDYGRMPDARLLTVEDPNNPGQKMEVSNVPIVEMPEVQVSDYETDGTTPMNKTLLAAMGAGSLRAEALKMGIGGKNRRSAMTYLVCASDGLNNIYSENIGGKMVSYDDSEVAKIARELLQTEQWFLGFAYAGGNQSAQYYANNIGFNMARDINNSPDSWRKFFGIVSQSVRQASMAAASATSLTNNNTFMSGV